MLDVLNARNREGLVASRHWHLWRQRNAHFLWRLSAPDYRAYGLALCPVQLEPAVTVPATHDGVSYDQSDPSVSRAAADHVEGMLMQLASEDQGWNPYWDDRMVWYGPGGLGSYATLDGFSAFQRPFEETFAGWGDGKADGITGVGSQCKSGDGEYTFLCGWPQLTGVQVKSFLGVPATNKRVFMRDCDWWRNENGKILENWCMLDIPHVLLQLGYDLFAEVSQTALD